MVEIKQFVKQQTTPTSSPLPLLNSLFQKNDSIFNSFTPDNSFKAFMHWARKSPQILGFVNLMVSDILSDKITFSPVNPKMSGRNKIKKSEEFMRVNKGREVMETTLYDFFINGIGFNWIGKLDETQVKEFCKKMIYAKYEFLEFKEEKEKELFLEFKTEELIEQTVRGEISSLARKLRSIPASTMRILNDDTKVTGYVQTVGSRRKKFSTDEVITFKYMPFDGRVYPFPPMEALLSEVYLLWLITQSDVSLFENGGNPDKIYVLPKEIAGSKNHKYLIETLKKYKKIQNKHGNLVFTGDLDVQDMMKSESKMDHKELGLYLVGVMAMFYGVPVGRIPFLVGKAASGGDAGGIADSGYWRKVSVWQSKIEEPYNACIFNPFFGTNMKFARGYKQDEVRETQTEMQKTQITEQRIRMGLWDEFAGAEYLGIDKEIVETAMARKKEREEEIKSSMLNQNLNNDKDVFQEPDKKVKNATKQSAANNNKLGNGEKIINP